MIMATPQEKEGRTHEQEIENIDGVAKGKLCKNTELVGDQNNSADQLIECTHPYCQVCFGIDGQEG